MHGVLLIPFLILNAAAVISSKVTTTGSSVSPDCDIFAVFLFLRLFEAEGDDGLSEVI